MKVCLFASQISDLDLESKIIHHYHLGRTNNSNDIQWPYILVSGCASHLVHLEQLPAVAPLHTLVVWHRVPDGAAQRSVSVVEGMEDVVPHVVPAFLPSPTTCTVSKVSQGKAGLPDQFVKPPPTSCRKAAALSDCTITIEPGWCRQNL